MPKLYPMTAEQKLNPLGAHLLNHYYTTQNIKTLEQKKINYPIYVLSSAKEIPLLMKCAEKEGLMTYGMVVVSGGRHRTPIMIDKSKAYIIESLGTSKSKVGINSAAQVAMGLKQADVPLEAIYTFKDNRQVDSQSCGSDSFIALKQAFRIKDSLDSFVAKEEKITLVLNNESVIDQEEKNDAFFKKPVELVQLKNLPPEIAKYSQTQSAVENYDYKTATLGHPNTKDHASETVSEYAKKHSKISTIPLNTEKEVHFRDQVLNLKSRKFVYANSALEKRRIKHDELLKNMATSLNEESIAEIIKESSGINLISRHLHEIPEAVLLSNLEGGKVANNSVSSDENTREDLIHDYVEEEMLKRRDEKSGVAPKGKMSLTELTERMKIAPTASAKSRI